MAPRFFFLWGFEFTVLYLLYRYVLSPLSGFWFWVVVVGLIFGYGIYLFGLFLDWKGEHENLESFKRYELHGKMPQQ